MIHTQTGAKAYLQFTLLLSKQVIQLQRHTHTTDFLIDPTGIVSITIAYAHSVAPARVALETAIIVDTHHVLRTKQFYRQTARLLLRKHQRAAAQCKY